LRLALPLAAAFLAALAAHIAIDFAGDFLLPHDTFDDAAHGSRWFAVFAMGTSAIGALWLLTRAVLAETRGRRGALRAALIAAVPKSAATFAAIVAALALPFILGMAWLDALSAGIAIDDVADLLGGSAPLGAALTVAFALAVAVGFHLLLACILRFHHSIIRAVEAFVRAVRGATGTSQCGAANTQNDRPRVPAALARCTGANRAPPTLPTRPQPA